MGDKTGIEWCDATWNPVVGCSVVSPGCTNCYAMRMAARLEKMGLPQYRGTTKPSKAGPVWTGEVYAPPDLLYAPLHRRKPTVYFVNSMGDLFHEHVVDEIIDRVFAVMALAPQHAFIVLTKRSKLMREYCTSRATLGGNIAGQAQIILEGPPPRVGETKTTYPAKIAARREEFVEWAYNRFPNVILGVSAEDQTRADERIPDLLTTPAATRVVSIEPMLSRIDLTTPEGWLWNYNDTGQREPVAGWPNHPRRKGGLDGVIVGGESGPGARPMHPDWARSIRDQCAAAGTPFFFKQWGQWLPGQNDVYDRFGDNRRVAHWQDGGWGPRDVSRGLASRNYVMWDRDGPAHPGGSRRAEHFEVAAWAQRVGKRRAGRLLDGREHNDLPWRRADA